MNFDEVKRGDTLRSKEGRLRQWRSLEHTSGGFPLSKHKQFKFNVLRTVEDACPYGYPNDITYHTAIYLTPLNLNYKKHKKTYHKNRKINKFPIAIFFI